MKYFKQFSLYTLVGFLNAGLGFLLMPYLSHFIDPAGYGILSMVNSLVTILVPLVGLTAAGIISVEYYKIKDKKQFASLFSSVQVIPVFPAIFFLVVCLAFQQPFARFLEIPKGQSFWVPLSVLIALFSIFFETQLVYLVIEQKPKQYVQFSLSKVLVEILLTLVFISALKLGWEGRLLSWMISTVLSFIVSLIYFRKKGLITKNINKKYIRAGILFGLPLILHTIGKFVINQSDRIFIAKMVSIEEAGIYNIGYQVGMVILLLVNAVGNFYQPFLYQRLSGLDSRGGVQIVRMTYGVIAGLFGVLVVLSLLSPLLFDLLIDKSYRAGVAYVFWTGLSYWLWGIYILFTGFIFFRKRTGVLGYLALVNVVLNIALNYFLISRFGALGAVYATCISFFVVAAVVVWVGTSLYRLPWSDFRLILGRNKQAPQGAVQNPVHENQSSQHTARDQYT